MASEYQHEGRLADARHLLHHVLAAAPNHADALHLSGIVAFQMGERRQALDYMQQALEHGIDTPLYLRNIAEVYRALGRLDEALTAARRASLLAPADPMCLHNQAMVHHNRLELDAALDCAARALAIDPGLPGAHFLRAEILLLRGEFAEGWEEYEWRFRLGGAGDMMPNIPRPQWDGGPFSKGTLLLVADQGFGDVIQFMRYIPWAEQRCPNLAVVANPELVSLLRQVAPRTRIYRHWRECAECAAFCAISGLPRLHGTTLGNIPAPVPYLKADPQRTARWKARLDGLVPSGFRRVGVVWAGRPSHNNDRNRSAGLADFQPIAEVSGVAMIALQKGPKYQQAGAWFSRAPLFNVGAEIVDFDDTIAILENLDLLVTVDTSIAHLAGAMGLPVWLMLPYVPDWRWLFDREDTPWYPTMRLFRQTAARRWDEVAQRVAQAMLAPTAQPILRCAGPSRTT